MTLGLLIQSIIAGIMNGVVYALIGLGIAAIYKGSGVINAMQGEFSIIAAIFASLAVSAAGWPYPVAALAGIASGMVIGLVVDLAFVRHMRIRNAAHDSYLLLILGLAITLAALVLQFAGSGSFSLPAYEPIEVWIILDAVLQSQALWLMGLSSLAIVAVRLFYRHTMLGMRMMAASIDDEGAMSIGVNVSLMRTLTFTLGGLLGAIAGVLISTVLPVDHQIGLILTLKGFAAAILGGLTNPIGAAVGGITIGLLESLAIVSVSSAYKDAITFAMLILIMIFLPNGMLGRGLRRS
ncbi:MULTISPECIES: branched-chain amino acid ABC transporter permease [unclassified Bradyrhizobium]|uniref:branched-chain amino acid ABC transporter permease n=1 Tax=unclassified Bradyrhizobium TaxID=2631580 RepID=UPI00247839CD|nr:MULTISPECIES: branched-chain amino acid ABC transporter permease [unclassified Bradyrhizobium]WGR73129.1 branched-chain amino acid ABC transporter permease [Bradyrhizobium sp. ISRA426]WGR77969.1 branched-chain amino acid ABC transporter permease [Bradyrhizobium sp. ISRA430]WGR88370.1 branched-chain amino acid ABC transporter permease [Bradyrhizobium sp. ISRA432]